MKRLRLPQKRLCFAIMLLWLSSTLIVFQLAFTFNWTKVDILKPFMCQSLQCDCDKRDNEMKIKEKIPSTSTIGDQPLLVLMPNTTTQYRVTSTHHKSTRSIELQQPGNQKSNLDSHKMSSKTSSQSPSIKVTKLIKATKTSVKLTTKKKKPYEFVKFDKHKQEDVKDGFQWSAKHCWCFQNSSTKRVVQDNTITLLVHSSRHHFQQRHLIRKTWGSVTNYKNWRIFPPVFLIGDKNDMELLGIEKQLQTENAMYGDLAKKYSNFIDSYKNLSFKHSMGYEWAIKYCDQAKFVLKSDDDIVIDIFKVISWLTKNRRQIESQHAFYCRLYQSYRPIRNVSSKWYMSIQDYSRDRYPNFCSGSSYITTTNVIKLIYPILNPTLNRVWLDDVYVTGLGVEKVNQRLSKSDNKSLVIKHIDRSYEYAYHHWQLEDGMNLIREWCHSTNINISPWSFILVEHGPKYEADYQLIWQKVCKVHNYHDLATIRRNMGNMTTTNNHTIPVMY